MPCRVRNGIPLFTGFFYGARLTGRREKHASPKGAWGEGRSARSRQANGNATAHTAERGERTASTKHHTRRSLVPPRRGTGDTSRVAVQRPLRSTEGEALSLDSARCTLELPVPRAVRVPSSEVFRSGRRSRLQVQIPSKGCASQPSTLTVRCVWVPTRLPCAMVVGVRV